MEEGKYPKVVIINSAAADEADEIYVGDRVSSRFTAALGTSLAGWQDIRNASRGQVWMKRMDQGANKKYDTSSIHKNVGKSCH